MKIKVKIKVKIFCSLKNIIYLCNPFVKRREISLKFLCGGFV